MKNQWKSLLLLTAALGVVLLYAFAFQDDIQFDARLTRAKVDGIFEPRPADSLSAASGLSAEQARQDSIAKARLTPDTTHQRVLFFGDSMLEGLTRRLVDYTEANGHELHTVVC